MGQLKERERMVYRRDGNIFEVIRIANDFVILQALDGLSQIMTGKKSLEFLFENALPRDVARRGFLAKSVYGHPGDGGQKFSL
jgi:hypothetical protein